MVREVARYLLYALVGLVVAPLCQVFFSGLMAGVLGGDYAGDYALLAVVFLLPSSAVLGSFAVPLGIALGRRYGKAESAGLRGGLIGTIIAVLIPWLAHWATQVSG
jgi:hypothetical protein